MRFTFDIPVAMEARVLDAFAAAYGYQATVDGQPNPETAQQFARRRIRDYIAEVVNGHEVNVAVATAADTARKNKVDL